MLPESFTGMDLFVRPAFYVPVMMQQRLNSARANPLEDRAARDFVVHGRLKSGVSVRQARAELMGLWSRLEEQYPDVNRHRMLAVRTELQTRIQSDRSTAIAIAMLMALVAIVLAIACANVANLMLGRASARTREMAIRLAIGAGRLRLLGQLLTESLLLALIGCALGLGFAYAGIRFLQTYQVASDLPIVISPRLDQRALAFSLLAAFVSALLFGLAPAWQSLRTELVPALKSSERGLATRSRMRGRNMLVVGQVALSMVLLIATGMLLDGFRRALILSPGFRTDHLIMMSTDTSLVGYTPAQTHNFYRSLTDRARVLPGVASVALTSSFPLDQAAQIKQVIPEGYQFPKGQVSASLSSAVVDEHYFSTLNVETIRGRVFTAADQPDSPAVAIVNEQFVKTYWPGQDPIGKRIQLNDGRGVWLEIVGVTRTGKYRSITERPTPFLYLPFAQNEMPRMTSVVETTNLDPSPLTAPLRDIVRTLDANQPVYNVRPVASLYEKRAIAGPLYIMRTVGTAGLLGLTLALIGLYGLVAYSVSRRTREIAIRMAMGADRSKVLRMVLRQGLMLSLLGILFGGLVSMPVARALSAALVGVGRPNPVTFVIVPVVLIVLSMLASYVPARHASRVDPLTALKYE